jgi:hypothetical protein
VKTREEQPIAGRPGRRQNLEPHASAEEERAERMWRWVRKLLFGDWHPLLRDPLDLMRLSFAVAAFGFLVAGEGSKAFHLFLNFLILVAARRLNMPRRFDLLFILGWGTQALGNAVNAFDLNYCTNVRIGRDNNVCLGYDNFVHFVIPLASIAPVYTLGLRLGVLPDISEETDWRERFGTVLFAALGVMALETFNEIWEYVAVNWLGLNLQIGYSDTIHDMALGVIGSLAGAVLIWVWAAERWPTERKAGPHESSARGSGWTTATGAR